VTLRYLSTSDVERCLLEVDVVASVRGVLAAHHRGETIIPDEAYLAWPGESRARSINMPGYIGGPVPVAGTKIINANPANITTGRRRAAGLTVLFDLATAAPTVVMDAAPVSAARTAAVSTLAGELFADRPRRLCLLGCGTVGAAHVVMMSARLSTLAEVIVYDIDPSRAEAFVANSGSRLATNVATSAEAAVSGADLIIATTTATQSYIPRAWLGPGSVTVNVSLDDLDSDALLECDMLFVDDWHLVRSDQRRLLGRLAAEGRVSGPGDPPRAGARRVDAELGAVIVGAHPGRTGADQVVVVNPFGVSIEDLGVAQAVAEIADRLGLGLPLEN